MKISITEEMKFRQRVVEYTIKHDNNAKAARRYDTSRQQVQSAEIGRASCRERV